MITELKSNLYKKAVKTIQIDIICLVVTLAALIYSLSPISIINQTQAIFGLWLCSVIAMCEALNSIWRARILIKTKDEELTGNEIQPFFMPLHTLKMNMVFTLLITLIAISCLISTII